MSKNYYDAADLRKFGKITEWNEELGTKFFDYYGKVFEEGALTMAGLTLSKSASFIGKTVKEAAQIFPEIHFVPIAIQRFGTQYTIIPRGNTKFKRGDTVVFVTSEGGADELCRLTGKVNRDIKNVMILGGSQIGYKTARDLSEKGFNVKLLEGDRDKAFDLAEELTKVLVINSDGRNVDLLEEENIGEMDAFIAVGGNSETNIMSCLVAKSKGVKKTIALVENMDYIDISQTIGIQSLINKKLIAASNIFRHIRKGEILALANLYNIDAEVFEFEVRENAKVTKQPIKELRFPREAVFGGVIRNEKAIMATGDMQIKTGDKVIVFCLPEAIHKVEKLFN